jgi:hypothetical protein
MPSAATIMRGAPLNMRWGVKGIQNSSSEFGTTEKS